MPFVSSLASTVGYGRIPVVAGGSNTAPGYYSSSSGYLLYQPGYSVTTAQLKLSTNIGNTTAIRTYTGFQTGWNMVHDKDLDSNVYYKMPESGAPKTLYKFVLAKGGTTVTQTTVGTYAGASTSVLGACYAPAYMWTGTAYGAFIIGGYSQAVIHILELNAAKTAIAATYTASIGTGEIYGTEIIPSQASGFTQHFAVFYTRSTRLIGSFTANMDTRTWSNLNQTQSYTPGTNGPSNGLGMIYYPPGKPIFTGDPDTALNRIGMTDTSSSGLFVWTIAQSGNILTFTYLKRVTMGDSGAYPYHMSVAAYDSIS
jgi:hypothetical protein